MKTFAVALALGLTIAGAAGAARAEMPDYDVNAHCKAIAAFGGAPSQTLLNACLQQEQAGIRSSQANWDALPVAMREHCDFIARFGGPGSFTLLDACVDQENAAARNNATFQFKR